MVNKNRSYAVLNVCWWMRFSVLAVSCMIFSCEADDPVKEDTPEVITKINLIFTPEAGDPVIASASDPDGEGARDLEVTSNIVLQADQVYSLRIELINELAASSSAAYDVSEEVEEEADEHLFLFGWTNDVFSSPEGDGNIDSRNDEVNYLDQDENGLPLGLTTEWATSGPSTGTFTVILKHQPDLKSETSGSETGETDLSINFTIVVEE